MMLLVWSMIWCHEITLVLVAVSYSKFLHIVLARLILLILRRGYSLIAINHGVMPSNHGVSHYACRAQKMHQKHELRI